MKISMLALTAATVALMVGGVSEAGGRARSSPVSKRQTGAVQWSSVTGTQTPTPTQSAMRLGATASAPYVDGTDGVTCYIYPGTDGALRDGWLVDYHREPTPQPEPAIYSVHRGGGTCRRQGAPRRTWDFANQAGGLFEVMGLGKVHWPSRECCVPFRALLSHSQFPYGARLERGQQHRREPMEHPANLVGVRAGTRRARSARGRSRRTRPSNLSSAVRSANGAERRTTLASCGSPRVRGANCPRWPLATSRCPSRRRFRSSATSKAAHRRSGRATA